MALNSKGDMSCNVLS